MEAIETKQIHIRFTRALSSYDNHADAQHRIKSETRFSPPSSGECPLQTDA